MYVSTYIQKYIRTSLCVKSKYLEPGYKKQLSSTPPPIPHTQKVKKAKKNIPHEENKNKKKLSHVLTY